MRIKVKNLPETVYGIYTAAVTFSLGSALYIYFRLSKSVDEIIDGRVSIVSGTLADTFQQLVWSTFFIAATMVIGLVVVMPIIKHQADTAEEQTDRADKFELVAMTDSLTGLHNRRYFQEIMNEFLKEFKRFNRPLSLLILDLDHFKNINDTYGHDVGDIVLIKVAALLKELVREHDTVARVGGEEFAVIAPFAGENQIIPFAERFRKKISELNIEVDNVVIRPTVSIGIAVSTEDNIVDVKDIYKRADLRLYEAKKLGRNRVCA